jgi:hypothetical protein
MYPSPVIDLKTFVPAQDSELSGKFYTDLGFTINWSNEQIAAAADRVFPIPAADVLRRRACGQFHDEPAGRGCRCLVGAHPAPGIHEEVPRHHVSAPRDAALGN